MTPGGLRPGSVMSERLSKFTMKMQFCADFGPKADPGERSLRLASFVRLKQLTEFCKGVLPDKAGQILYERNPGRTR